MEVSSEEEQAQSVSHMSSSSEEDKRTLMELRLNRKRAAPKRLVYGPKIGDNVVEEEYEIDGLAIARIGKVGDDIVRYHAHFKNFDFPHVEESDIQEELLYRDPMTRWAASPTKVDKRHEISKFLYANALSKPLSLSAIKIMYDVPKIFQLKNSRERAICDPPPNFISVYLAHLKVGLRFPVIPLLRDICVYWQLPLAQLTPNCIKTILAFVLLCKSCGVVANLELFRHYFIMNHKHNLGNFRGWFFAQRRNLSQELFSLPTTVHSWKGEFFFVNHISTQDFMIPWNQAKNLDNSKPLGVDEASITRLSKLNFVWYLGGGWNSTTCRDGNLYGDGVLDIKRLSNDALSFLF